MNTPEDYLKTSAFTRFAIFELYLFLQLFIITYHPLLRRGCGGQSQGQPGVVTVTGGAGGNRVACDASKGGVGNYWWYEV